MASPLPLLLDLVPAFPLSLSPLPVVAFLESPPNNYNNNKTTQSVIELSRTQDEEVGDGTTSVIILGTKKRAFFPPSSSFSSSSGPVRGDRRPSSPSSGFELVAFLLLLPLRSSLPRRSWWQGANIH